MLQKLWSALVPVLMSVFFGNGNLFQLLTTQFSGGTILNLLLFSCSSDCQGCPPQAADELVLRHGAGSEAELTLVTSEFRLPTIFGRFFGRAFSAFAKLRS